jgi:hypothetical protein
LDQIPSYLLWASLVTALVLGALVIAWFRQRRTSRRSRKHSAEMEKVWEKFSASQDLLKADIATSQGVGGTVHLLQTATLEASRGIQSSRGATSYPTLVRGFKEFALSLHGAGLRLNIGIDELDKLSSDDARTFLNGLKAIFGVPGANFIVSVSEDAMSDFERRGIPLRDAFDTSLDEVVRMRELSVQESMQLLQDRSNYAFPLSYGALCHCLSGGLPRELLRVARRLVRTNSEFRDDTEKFGKMPPLCWRLVDDDLTAKSGAIWVAARSSNVEPYGTRFRSWLSTVDASRGDPKDLLAACEQYLGFPQVEPGEAAALTEDDTSIIRRLHSLTLEFVGYRYFAATLNEFFSSTSDKALSDSLEPQAGDGSLDILSSARRRFADDPRLAWSLVSRFRKARSMKPVLDTPPEGLRLPVPPPHQIGSSQSRV